MSDSHQQDIFNKLREKYPIFIYKNFSYQINNSSLTINYTFEVPPDISFSPKLIIEKNDNEDFQNNIDENVIKNLIFNLGLVEMISYWKATCSPQIQIDAGNLNENQKEWWKKLITKGMGEFFYTNRIDFTKNNLFEIIASDKTIYQKDEKEHTNRFLIPIGGGRDSAVAAETLKESKNNLNALLLNPTQAALDITREVGVENPIIVKRAIGPKLLELNKGKYLNGHTPFSAYLAFLSLLCAVIFDYQSTTPANERSANEENVEYLGHKINHQYSKSFEFEKDFREYSKEYLSKNIEYFSVLRPLYEIQISKIFSNYHDYFELFKSCNRGQKTNSWCKSCPKCLSIYISLYPFLKENDRNKIFGEDLYENESLKSILIQLIGKGDHKPFECVGTIEEVITGLYLSIKKLENEERSLPILLKEARKLIDFNNQEENAKSLLNAWNDEHFIPLQLAEILKKNGNISSSAER